HLALFQKWRAGTTSRAGPPCSGASGAPSYPYATNACPLRTSPSGRFVVEPPSDQAITKAADGSSSTFSNEVSTLTPRQFMSTLVHFVTQLMSTVHSRAEMA